MVSSPFSPRVTRPPRTSSSRARKVATLVLRLCRGENSWPMRAAAPLMRLRRIYTTRLVTDTMGAVTSGSNCCWVGSRRRRVRPARAFQ